MQAIAFRRKYRKYTRYSDSWLGNITSKKDLIFTTNVTSISSVRKLLAQAS